MTRFSIAKSWMRALLGAFVAVGFATAALYAAEPNTAADLAPGGVWKLADLTDTMQTLRGRSYENGRRLFERAHCTMCHRQDKVGVEFGPDLTKLESRFQPLDILRDILDPSRRIADAKFDVWMFETDAGQTVSGLILQENSQRVEVAEKPPSMAPAVVIPKADIVERKMSLVSMMPQGLLNQLTREEIADLVAYVAARGDPTDPLVQPAQ